MAGEKNPVPRSKRGSKLPEPKPPERSEPMPLVPDFLPAQVPPAPLLVVILGNLLLLGVVFIVIDLFWRGVVISREELPLPCVAPEGVAFTWSVVIVSIAHVLYRLIFRPPLPEWVSFSIFGVDIVQVLRVLQPGLLSTPVLIGLALVLSLGAWLFGIGSLSPFQLDDTPPVIESIIVMMNGRPTPVQQDTEIQIERGQFVSVEATLRGRTDVTCEWQTSRGPMAKGCTTNYSPPFDRERDTLSVRASAPCGGHQAHAGIHLKIVAPQ